MKKSIINMNVAGCKIIDAIFTDDDQGYCIGVSESQYATWWFRVYGERVDFYHGHYCIIDQRNPKKSHAQAMWDFYERVAGGFKQTAKWSRWEG